MDLATYIDTATRHYLMALLWTDGLDDQGFTVEDVPTDVVLAAREDVAGFVTTCSEERPEALVKITAEQFGHDFALTRNRHGAGFWDRGNGELGDWLTSMAHPFGSAALDTGDDGQIYMI